jgi:glycosyltransferase involved in cell wall biosynthesis
METNRLTKAPFFSIVIPTYNRETVIGRALKSLVAQSFRNFEVIVIDDGSTDDTEKVVTRLEDIRIKYFKKKNEERNIARNTGIALSRGRYVNFLDSDDYVYPYHLEEASKTLKEKQFPELLHLAYEVRNEKREIVSQAKVLPSIINQELIKENLLSLNGVFVRSDIIKEHNFLPSRNAILAEDHYLWLKLAARYKFYCINTVTSVIVEHQQRSLRLIDSEKIEKGIEEIVADLKKDTAFQKYYGRKAYKFFSQLHSLVALIYSEKKSKKKKKRAIVNLWKSLVFFPLIVFSKRWLASLRNVLIGS